MVAKQILTLDERQAEAIRKAMREDGAADRSVQSRAEEAPWLFFGNALMMGLSYQRTSPSDVPPWGYAG